MSKDNEDLTGHGVKVDESSGFMEVYEAQAAALNQAWGIMMAVTGNDNFESMSADFLAAALWSVYALDRASFGSRVSATSTPRRGHQKQSSVATQPRLRPGSVSA